MLGTKRAGNYQGLAFPYITPGQDHVADYRVRRDSPDAEFQADGNTKLTNKYMWPPGRRSRLYFVPGTQVCDLNDTSLSLVITEGEKKTLALDRLARWGTERRWLAVGAPGVWGWRGTTGKAEGPEGARHDVKGPLPDLDLIAFDGREVFIVFDSDVHTNPQVKQAQDSLARELASRGARVQIVELPEGGQKVGVDDLLARQGPEFVLTLFKGALPARPAINASDQDLERVSHQAWESLRLDNRPEHLFRRGGGIVRVETDGGMQGRIVEVNPAILRHHVARSADWYRPAKNGTKRASGKPSMDVVSDMLAHPDYPLPILDRLVRHPILTSVGLVNKPGYNFASRTYLGLRGEAPVIPVHPTRSEMSAAREVLYGLVQDFPFVSDADRAHTLAAILLPFVRGLIDGPTPLILITKPAPGTGGTLLSDVIAHIAEGSAVGSIVESGNEEEWRKQLTSALIVSPEFIIIDNLRNPLNSAALASAITQAIWSDRMLGGNKKADVPVLCGWMANGNNPSLSSEMNRRTVRIRLDARRERPELRDGFRIPNLRAYVNENRNQLMGAALTLAVAWREAGKPEFGDRTMGSFDRWAAVIGEILEVAEVPGFLANQQEARADTEVDEGMLAFIHEWWEKFQDGTVGASDLYPVAIGAEFDLGNGEERSQRTRLGSQLTRLADRVFELSSQLAVAVRKMALLRGAAQYRLERALGPTQGALAP